MALRHGSARRVAPQLNQVRVSPIESDYTRCTIRARSGLYSRVRQAAAQLSRVADIEINAREDWFSLRGVRPCGLRVYGDWVISIEGFDFVGKARLASFFF